MPLWHWVITASPAQVYSIDNVTDGSFSTTEADKQKKYQVYLEDEAGVVDEVVTLSDVEAKQSQKMWGKIKWMLASI